MSVFRALRNYLLTYVVALVVIVAVSRNERNKTGANLSFTKRVRAE